MGKVRTTTGSNPSLNAGLPLSAVSANNMSVDASAALAILGV